MKITSGLFFITLLLPTLSFAQNFNESPKEWFACNQDADCTLTYNECGNFVGVNLKSLQQAENFYKDLGPKVNCVAPSTSFQKSDFRVTCQHTKEPCIIKKWFGLVKEIDPASTCASETKKCVAQIQYEQSK